MGGLIVNREVRIYTPENVSLQYDVANLGSRLVAVFIDTAIQLAVILLLVITVVFVIPSILADFAARIEISPAIIGVILIVVFLVDFFYNIFFELVMNGQTPGKKFARIKVTSVTGEPVNFIKSFIRNLVRLVDMMPTSYIVGMVVLLLSKKCQRLGDLAANTMVIKVRDSKDFKEKVARILQEKEGQQQESKAEEQVKDIFISENTAEFAVDEKSYRILKEYMTVRERFIRNEHYDYIMFRYINEITGNKVPNTLLPFYRLRFLMDVINQNAPYYEEQLKDS